MPSVYLETTIFSYLAAHPSRDLIIAAHQQITYDWWRDARDRFELYVSEAVLNEIRQAEGRIRNSNKALGQRDVRDGHGGGDEGRELA